MESQQPARNVFAVVFGLVILAAFFPAPVAAAPLSAHILLDTDRFVVGTKWTLDVVVNTGDPLSVRFSYGTLPATLALIDGPNIRETSWEETPGKMSRATRISLTLKTLKPGIQELGPWVVKVGSQEVSVPPVTVYLLAVDEAKRRFPVDVDWVVPPGPYYQGQAIPLLLQVKNLDTLVQPEDITVAAPSGALLEKVSGLGEIEISSAGEDRIMNIPWGGWMLIPTKEGTVYLPSVKVSIDGLLRVAPALTLDVLPLPAADKTSRAVGDLTYSIDAKEGTDDQRGQLIVTQEVKGQGNFPSLVLPSVTVENLSLLARQENAHYKATANGYEGNLVVTWRFQSEKAGELNFVLPGFQAFQPATGLVKVWEDRTVAMALAPAPIDKVVAVQKAAPLTWRQVVGARPWGLLDSWPGYALLLPGVIFWLTTFFGRKGRGRGLFVMLPVTVLFLSAAGQVPIGDAPQGFTEAASLNDWNVLVGAHPEEPGLWYNQALAAADAGQTAVAIHGFRMALKLGFQGPEAAAALRTFEEAQGLVDQFRPWSGWPADLLFLLLIVSVNLGFAFWGFQRLTGRPFWLILASLALMGAALSATVLVTAQSIRLEADAVVGLLDGPLKKVPGPLAEKWMSLRAGTVVKVLGRTEGDVLVQTGYGLEGWLGADHLLGLVASP